MRVCTMTLLLSLLLAPARAQEEELRFFGKGAKEYAEELASEDRRVSTRAYNELFAVRRKAVPLFAKLMDDPRAAVREGAIRAFYWLVDPAMEPLLVTALEDEDAGVRDLAYDGLQAQGPHVVPILVKYVDSLPPLQGSVGRFGPVWTGRRAFTESFAWSPDGTLIAIGEKRGRITLWDWRRQEPRVRLILSRAVEDPIHWSPDGSKLEARANDLDVWSTKRTPAGNTASIPALFPSGGRAFDWSPDSKRYACGGRSSVRVCTTRHHVVRSWGIDRKYGEVWDLDFAPNGRQVAVVMTESRIAILDLSGGIRWLPEDVSGEHVSWSPDGERLAISDWGRIAVVRAGDGRTVWARSCAAADDNCEWSPDGSRIMFSLRPVIAIVHAETGARLRSFDCHPYWCSGPVWSPDARRLAMHDAMGNVWILDTLPRATGDDEAPLPGVTLEDLWARLSDREAVRAIRAENTMVGAGEECVKLIESRLKPVAKTTRLAVNMLIRIALGAEEGEVDVARERLAGLGRAAHRLASKEPLAGRETEHRRLLDWLRARHVDAGTLRALSILVRQGTPESKAVLEKLASGQSGAPLTMAARGFLRAWR